MIKETIITDSSRLTPLLVRGAISEFESFHRSRNSNTNITSDDAWMFQLRELSNHTVPRVFYPDLLAVGRVTHDMCACIVRQDYTGARFHALC